MKINPILFVSLVFGFFFCCFFCLFNSFSIWVGVSMGAGFGLLTGLLFYGFVNWNLIKRQAGLTSNELFPGEIILFEAPANLIVAPKTFNLKPFAFDQFSWVFGMKEKEALGGRAYLTNYRVVFKTHRINRLKGRISVFLETITSSVDTSKFILQRVTIKTYMAKLDFVIQQPEKFVAIINTKQQQLTDTEKENIKQAVIQHPSLCTDGLIAVDAVNIINNIFLMKDKIEEKIELFTDPLSAVGGLLMKELLDKTIADRWNDRFET